MFENEAAAFRLVGYLEEAMKTIERLCNTPAATKDAKARVISEVKRVATTSIERARLLP